MKRNNSRITLNESEIICNIIKKKMYLRMILVISLQRSKYFGKYVFPYSSVDGKFQFPIKKKKLLPNFTIVVERVEFFFFNFRYAAKSNNTRRMLLRIVRNISK